ncbi:hypothetical protein EJ03DRAFT_63957 [Teratosphaeria nubilosa]|uniref:Uncharacterized protein n=1 Tax=Teratosphaeria nubilosa TaxID=161662 RepID=A0A6G1LDJ0_9PEZI|nr:hypothetical protein EJ03DRAFT_63957 [Teratosphaeria nubilosa]
MSILQDSATGFGLVQRATPDDNDKGGGAEVRWGLAESDMGSLHLDIDFSGLYAGLRFEDSVSHENFVLMLGIHNYKPWIDVTGVEEQETVWRWRFRSQRGQCMQRSFV